MSFPSAFSNITRFLFVERERRYACSTGLIVYGRYQICQIFRDHISKDLNWSSVITLNFKADGS